MSHNRRYFLKNASLIASIPFVPSITSLTRNTNNQAEQTQDWEFIRSQFPLERERIYFNNGTFGPSPNKVIETMAASFLEVNRTGKYGNTENTQLKIAKLVGAKKKEIALTRNTTEGINIMATGLNLKRGEEIIMTSHEHVGNALPWLLRSKNDNLKISVFEPATTADENIDRIKKLINRRTRVIAIPHITCTTGLVFPLKEIAEIARAKGIITAIDGAHGLGMFNLDVKQLNVDMYASCGHKWLLGPAGTACLYVREGMLPFVQPTHVGAYSIDGFTLNETSQDLENFSSTAHKYHYGTQSHAHFAGMTAAVNFQEDIGLPKIEKRVLDLSDYLFEGLEDLGSKVKILSPSEKSSRSAMITFKCTTKDFHQTQKILGRQQIRIRKIGEANLNAIRVSTHFYNSTDEIDFLLETLKSRVLQS